MAGADPANKVGGSDFSNIWQPSLITASLLQERWSTAYFTTLRDKTMDDKMALYRECCFPICTKSWWI